MRVSRNKLKGGDMTLHLFQTLQLVPIRTKQVVRVRRDFMNLSHHFGIRLRIILPGGQKHLFFLMNPNPLFFTASSKRFETFPLSNLEKGLLDTLELLSLLG